MVMLQLDPGPMLGNLQQDDHPVLAGFTMKDTFKSLKGAFRNAYRIAFPLTGVPQSGGPGSLPGYCRNAPVS